MKPGGGRQAARQALALEIAPDLPIWHPEPPAQGWSPATVWSAASNYADDHAEPAVWRRITGDAARALFRELSQVKRQEIRERLQGIDRRAETLDLSPAYNDLGEDPAPF